MRLRGRRINGSVLSLGARGQHTLLVKQLLLGGGAVVDALELEAEGLGLVLRIGDSDDVRQRVFVPRGALSGNNGVLIELVPEQGSYTGKHADAHGGDGGPQGKVRREGGRTQQLIEETKRSARDGQTYRCGTGERESLRGLFAGGLRPVARSNYRYAARAVYAACPPASTPSSVSRPVVPTITTALPARAANLRSRRLLGPPAQLLRFDLCVVQSGSRRLPKCRSARSPDVRREA